MLASRLTLDSSFSTGGRQLAEAFNGVLETTVEEFSDAFVHDGLLQHFYLEEVANKPYKAE